MPGTYNPCPVAQLWPSAAEDLGIARTDTPMRNNQPVTQRERTFPAQQRLISTTDLKGQITYCNEAFIEISGFSREELMRAPHNLVRHPDVPPAVFAHLW